ncbi:MAG: O-antigen ligase family protein [Candidatus Promineifilaceae bacterium]|nr:O-antigen ligase family protein [Candidatus Promineifilaceae bacterium]
MGRWTWLHLALALAAGLTIVLLPLPVASLTVVLVGAIVGILIQPFAALFLMLLAAPLGALESLYFPSLPLTSGQVLFLVFMSAWLARRLIEGRLALPRVRLLLPLLGFTLVAALSLLEAQSLTLGLKELAKWVEVTLLIMAVVDLSNPTGHRPSRSLGSTTIGLNWIILMILVAGASQALIGAWQFGLASSGPDHFMVLDRFYRAFGTFQQPNPFGGFVGITALFGLGVGLGLAMAVYQKVREDHEWPWASIIWLVLFAALTLLAGLAVLFSWSRGAWLGFGAGLGVTLFFWPRRASRGVLLVLLAILMVTAGWRLGLFPSALSERLVSLQTELQLDDVRGVEITVGNFAVVERLAHWQAALGMVRERPWLGVGLGNYESAYSEHALLDWPLALGHAHNYYLNIAAETGVVGLLAYGTLWVAVFWQCLRLLHRLEWSSRGVALGLLAAWTMLSVHHLFDNLYVNNLYLTVGVLLGIQQLLDRRVSWSA